MIHAWLEIFRTSLSFPCHILYMSSSSMERSQRHVAQARGVARCRGKFRMVTRLIETLSLLNHFHHERPRHLSEAPSSKPFTRATALSTTENGRRTRRDKQENHPNHYNRWWTKYSDVHPSDCNGQGVGNARIRDIGFMHPDKAPPGTPSPQKGICIPTPNAS